MRLERQITVPQYANGNPAVVVVGATMTIVDEESSLGKRQFPHRLL